MKKKVLPEVEPVVLNSFAGHRAGFWILLSLLGILLIVVFLLFFLPGIINGGKYITFFSPLSDTAVYVDGVYQGSTENKYFIKSGEHEAVFIKADCEIGNISFEVSNPIFGTLFIHYEDQISADISNYTDEMKANNRLQYAEDLTRYSAVTDYNEFYFYNPIITKYFSDSLTYNSSTIADDYLYTLSHITSKEMLDDFNNATSLLAEKGYTFNYDINLEEIITQEGKTITVTENNESIPPYITGKVFTYPESTITLGKTTQTSYPNCNVAPVTLNVSEFSILQTMVTEKEYALFVQDNPIWSKENVTPDMADENYLKGIDLTSPTDLPIRNISYKAAVAYCEYISEIEGKVYRLPTEAEWTVMANSVRDKAYSTSLYTLSLSSNYPSSVMGGLWEFTSSYYLPLSRLIDYTEVQNIAKALNKDDIIIKGGSYINNSSEIDKEDVGIITQIQTSPYVGIRLCVEN